MKRIGIYGGGMIARFHAQAIQAMGNATLAGIRARRTDTTQALASEFGCRAFDSDEAFFSDPEIDIVAIATPSGAHLDAALKAAKAGKHIICEKPLEVTPELIDQMAAVCSENGVTLGAIFNRRFQPAYEAFKQAAATGRFGQLALVKASIKWYREPSYYSSSKWKGTWALDGGGALMNQSIHTIDQLLCLAGPAKSVRALSTRILHKNIEVEDTAAALIEFANGAIGLIEGSTACWSKTGNPAEVHLSGSQGTVIMQDECFRVWEFANERPEDRLVKDTLMVSVNAKGLGANDPKAINFEGHRRNFEAFVTAIESGRSPSIDAAEARKAVALICAIYESARLGGQKIEL